MVEILTSPLHASGGVGDFVGSSIDAGQDVNALVGESPFRVLYALATRSFTGHVGIRAPEKSYAFKLRRGALIHASSDDATDDEALLSEIFEEGVGATGDIKRAIEHCEKTGADLARSLHKHHALDPAQLAHAIRAVYVKRVEEATEITSGQLFVAPSSAVGESSLSTAITLDIVSLLAHVLRNRARRLYYRDLETLLAPILHRYIAVDPAKTALLDTIGLETRERHAIDHTITGEYRVEELFTVSILSKNEVARLLLQLFVFGIADISGQGMVHEDETHAALARTLKRLLKANHFVRLDGHWSTHPDDLQENFDRLTARYDRLGKRPETTEIAAEIYQLVEGSYQFLKDRKQRIAYRRSMVMEDQLLHSSELIFAQAKAAEFRAQRSLARKLYECVDELFPTPETKACINALKPEFMRNQEAI